MRTTTEIETDIVSRRTIISTHQQLITGYKTELKSLEQELIDSKDRIINVGDRVLLTTGSRKLECKVICVHDNYLYALLVESNNRLFLNTNYNSWSFSKLTTHSLNGLISHTPWEIFEIRDKSQ